MRIFIFIAASLFFLTGLSSAGHADQGYSAAMLNVRSGPGVNYPIVDRIAPNRLMNINGCLEGVSWCEIERDGIYGWVVASRLQGIYNNRRVPLTSYGARLGVPLLVFEERDYWNQHYRDRDFYRDRYDSDRGSSRRDRNDWSDLRGYHGHQYNQ